MTIKRFKNAQAFDAAISAHPAVSLAVAFGQFMDIPRPEIFPCFARQTAEGFDLVDPTRCWWSALSVSAESENVWCGWAEADDPFDALQQMLAFAAADTKTGSASEADHNARLYLDSPEGSPGLMWRGDGQHRWAVRGVGGSAQLYDGPVWVLRRPNGATQLTVGGDAVQALARLNGNRGVWRIDAPPAKVPGLRAAGELPQLTLRDLTRQREDLVVYVCDGKLSPNKPAPVAAAPPAKWQGRDQVQNPWVTHPHTGWKVRLSDVSLLGPESGIFEGLSDGKPKVSEKLATFGPPPSGVAPDLAGLGLLAGAALDISKSQYKQAQHRAELVYPDRVLVAQGNPVGEETLLRWALRCLGNAWRAGSIQVPFGPSAKLRIDGQVAQNVRVEPDGFGELVIGPKVATHSGWYVMTWRAKETKQPNGYNVQASNPWRALEKIVAEGFMPWDEVGDDLRLNWDEESAELTKFDNCPLPMPGSTPVAMELRAAYLCKTTERVDILWDLMRVRAKEMFTAEMWVVAGLIDGMSDANKMKCDKFNREQLAAFALQRAEQLGINFEGGK